MCTSHDSANLNPSLGKPKPNHEWLVTSIRVEGSLTGIN